MVKKIMLPCIITLTLLLPISLIGCGGGGGETSDQPGSSSIEVTPASHDFGIATGDNLPTPLLVTIKNNGSANLNIFGVVLSEEVNFDLDENGGLDSCDTLSPTITPGDFCTVTVAFKPTSNDSFGSTLTINSDAPNNPISEVLLTGSRDDILALNLRINQVETDLNCPNAEVTAFVSVIDQGGYPVTGLLANDFLITEAGGYVGSPDDVSFASQITAPISVALVMDYSGSMKSAGAIEPMEDAITALINELNADDEAEIIKFSSVVEVAQGFTSDKELLIAAVNAVWDRPNGSLVYDAVYRAIDDIASAPSRKGAILITDGLDSGSTNGFSDLIDYALLNDVPLFIIGFGNNIDVATLTQMAEETGGEYYEAATPQELANIYDQLSAILFEDQYVLTYTSGLGFGVTADLTIKASLQTIGGLIEGFDTKEITPCP